MPLAVVLLVINAICIVHAAKTGRFWPWGYVVLLLPGIGALAYILLELVPEWSGSAQGHRARRQISAAVNPEKRYRELSDHLDVADTVANRIALAEECLGLGKFEEAKRHYEEVLARPLGDEPQYMLGKARAEFGLGNAQATVATLDELRQRWPDYQSAEGHLLYARALEESGRGQEALDEYQALSNYHTGAEARVRYALLLDKSGRHAEAKALFVEIVTRFRRAPKYVRKMQAEWIAIAEKAVRH